jgi:hypothetical protein
MLRKYLALLLVFLGALTLSAQNYSGGVAGTVTDSTGAVIPGAQITLKSVATDATRTTQTTTAGLFEFETLPVGVYELTASASGFGAKKVTGIIIEAGRTASLPLTLKVAAAATITETVTADAITLDTEETSQTAIISPDVMASVPLNGRDYTQLLKLVPGYANSANMSGTLNGGRTNSIDFQIDGVDNNDPWFATNAVNQGAQASIAATLLPIDSIEELSIQSQGSVDMGHTSGGAVNAVLKSGSNKLHGTAYYYNRNEDLSLANWYGPTVPKIRNQEFGGSVGGPIQRDKTFFFLSYEQQKLLLGNGAWAQTVPSPAWVSLASGLLKARSVAVNPVSTNVLGFFAGMGNAPATMQNFTTTQADDDYSYNGLVKLDHTFKDQSNLSLRWFQGQGIQNAPDGSVLPAYWNKDPTQINNLAAVYRKTFGSSLTTQTLVGLNFAIYGFYDDNTMFNPITAGLNTGVNPVAIPGAPDIAIGPFTEIGQQSPTRRYEYTGHITENDNYIHGKHEFHFGGEYRHGVLNAAYHRGQKGAFNFSGNLGPNLTPLPNDNAAMGSDAWNAYNYLVSQGDTAATALNLASALDSLADFMAGEVPSGGASINEGNVVRRYLVDGLSFYGGDNFRVTSNLTVNYGLYWGFVSPPKDPTNTISTFIPNEGGFVFTGHGIDTIYPKDLRDFAPRLGFNWQPKGASKLVVRGGFGFYYQPPNLNLFSDNRPRDYNHSYGVQYNSHVYAVSGSPNTDVCNYSNPSAFTIQSGALLFPSCAALSTSNLQMGGFGVDQKFVDSYSENANINAEYQLSRNTVLEVGYVGSEAHKLPITLEINQIPFGADASPNNPDDTKRPYYNIFPKLEGIDQVSSVSHSRYNSIIASLRTANWHNIAATVNYTYGHALDNMSNPRGSNPSNSYNLNQDWGNSDYDVRHTFGSYLSYTIPTPNEYKKVLGGWQLNSWITALTGNPFTVGAETDTSLDAVGRDRADVIGDPTKVKGPEVAHQGKPWFNTNPCSATVTINCFGEPNILSSTGAYIPTIGTEKRNQFYGPGLGEVDFSVFKNTPITERIGSQFRVEIYNLFNRVNSTQPNTCLGCGAGTNFGYSTNTKMQGNAPGIGQGEPFNVQLALKLTF